MKSDYVSVTRIPGRNIASIAAIIMVFLALFSGTPRGLAQGDSVTVSAAEFQRLVYSGHVLAQMDSKPELDASLFVLLELQRRNPQMDPVALADLCREALVRYQTNAPACVRNSAWRDEVLAAYLDAFRQIPAHTNLNSATFALINPLVSHLNAPAAMPQTELLNAGIERLLSTEENLPERQSVVNANANRAASRAAFGAALDRLLVPEIGVSVTNTPAEIINATAALSNSPTLRALLQLSQTSPTHGVQISLSQLKALFTEEISVLQETVATNMAVDLEISRRQANWPACLANQQMLSTDMQREAQVYQLQAQKITASHASFNIVSSMASYKDAKLGNDLKTVGNALSSVASGIGMLTMSGGLNMVGGCASLLSAGLGIFSLFDTGPSPDEIILQGIDDLKYMIRDFSDHVDYRFDRVDQSLNEIYQNLNTRLDQIDLQLGQVQGDVNQIRRDLLVTQNDLHRLERELYDYLNAGFRRELVAVINGALGYEKNFGQPMDYSTFTQIPDGPENTFYTWAFSNTKDPLSSPATFAPADLTDGALLTKLDSLPLESSLNYLNQFLSNRFDVPSFGPTPIANPRDWFVSAQAYLQLAAENPLHFRRVATNRLNNIIANGQELQSYFQNLLFTGGGTSLRLNTNLHNAALDYYESKLNAFSNQVRATEQQYAADHHFPMLQTWRQWGLAAPRVTTTTTELLESHTERPVISLPDVPPGSRLPNDIIALGGDVSHSFGLALQAESTVMGWGDNDSGQATIPSGLSNVVALAAGAEHSLALCQDGTVAAWGDSYYGKNTTPAMAANVVSIGTGRDHNLAVRDDGTVVGWGYNSYGQATGEPTTGYPYCSTGLVMVAGQTLTNVAAADGGFYFSLALKKDGTVAVWGAGQYGETNVPAGLSNVMAIAAGGFFSLTLQSNGTVVGFGNDDYGQTDVTIGLTNVVAVAAGSHHSLALRSDGTVVAWGSDGYGKTNVPAGLSNVVAIAADQNNSLALRSDGTLVVWGYNTWLWDGPLPVPAGLTNILAAEGGSEHCLALQADGSLVVWGRNTYGQTNIPGGLSNVVAIAAGDYHNVVLRSDGTVVAWGTGYWNYGQTNVPADLSNAVAITAGAEFSAALKGDGTVVTWGRNIGAKPATVTNVVAISAGKYFCEALTADGRVLAWGNNSYNQCNVPADATNVVDIAVGSLHSLALRADGTVVAWGRNDAGCCNVPADLSNVVAITAGYFVSTALKADGTVVTWGDNYYSQSNVPREATNIVAIGAGYPYTLYVQSACQADADASSAMELVRDPIPVRVRDYLWGVNAEVLTNLDLDLHEAAAELSGSKALLDAVLSLGMPYTLERDDVLHGFLYGGEPLVGLEAAHQLLLEEMEAIQSPPFLPTLKLSETAADRFACFKERLQTRLNEIAQTGQPESPRLVGHTLRLLNLLRDARRTVPQPTLELSRETNTLNLILYGEPYAHYALQSCNNVSTPVWSATTITNFQNEKVITLPVSSGANRFYRSVLPPAP